MSIWMWAGFWLGVVVYPVAWIWGGRVERFATMMLVVQCLVMGTNHVFDWSIGGTYTTGKVVDFVCLLIFCRLCFRSDRWWPLLMAAGLALKALADVVGWLDPGVSDFGVASAKIGLGYLIDLTLLLGVLERWLAGEEPAGQAAWARAHGATLARRNRKPKVRRRTATPLGKPATAGSA